MKLSTYYFSGTGNSLVVARKITDELNGELISIPTVINNESIKTDADVIGIIFPVYIWGIPNIIERFVKKIDNIENKYIFAVVTCGSIPGATINLLEKVIKSCGGKLAGGFKIKMPNNYTPMYEAVSETKQNKMFSICDERIKIISEYVKSQKQGKKENSNIFINLIFTSLINKSAYKYIPKMDHRFWILNKKCNGCGLCAKVCSVDNIEMINDKPSWKGHCEQCFACLQWCPQESIQYGSKTSTRKRYHNPNINISDIMK